MQKVVSILKNIISPKQNDISIDGGVTENRENNSSFISRSSEIIIDNNNLLINNIPNISQFEIIKSENNSCSQNQESDQSNTMNYENNSNALVLFSSVLML